MTHELKKIFEAYLKANAKQLKNVLATVVALEGSSYRKPGVRMLISEDGKMTGAVSGGCVEKEVLRQAQSVFNDGIPKIMTYDGRYRLGCEGVLYILIEPFSPSESVLHSFQEVLKHRRTFQVSAYYEKKDAANPFFGSMFTVEGESQCFRDDFMPDTSLSLFEQRMSPCFRLFIIGAEHDAVQLSGFASNTGWEVTVVADVSEEKNISDFPGAVDFISCLPEALDTKQIDHRSAVILMTHSYVKDLKYLLRLVTTEPVYLGLLGPAQRREKLLNEFLEHNPQVPDSFFDRIHGPAGLNIGAETPQEIAIAIIAEILSVVRKKEPMMLKNKIGRIHS